MASAHAITDHDEIREWAEQRGAYPACVKGTGRKGDTGMIRLDFPGYSGGGSLQSISWDDWFRQFDDNNLALLVQDSTSRGQQSNFNKLVSRDTVDTRGGRSAGSTKRSARSTSRRSAASQSRPSSARSRKTSRTRASSAGKSSQRPRRKTSRTRARKATVRSRSRR